MTKDREVKIMAARRVLVPVVGFALLLGTLVAPAPTGAEANVVIQTSKEAVSYLAFAPCAVGGAGEYVQLGGSARTRLQATYNANGGVSIVITANQQGVRGVGLTSGDTYVFAQELIYHVTDVDPFALGGTYEETFVRPAMLIGQGPGNNVRILALAHLTIDATGEIAVQFGYGSDKIDECG